MGIAKKTARRTAFLDELMKTLTSKRTFGIIGKSKCEREIVGYMHNTLRNDFERILAHLNPNWSEQNVKAHAERSIFWEGDISTTVNNIRFMGMQHRPDFFVKFDDARVAVEVKKGENGSAIREALGQCLVYATEYEFVCCVIVDSSQDEKVKRAFEQGEAESELRTKLWDTFNIRLDVV